MTHAEYDVDKWKAECGCFAPSPADAREEDAVYTYQKKSKKAVTSSVQVAVWHEGQGL
jgi:hypothetical protein